MFEPKRDQFQVDPFSYGALAWHRLETAKMKVDCSYTPKDFPSSTDLKDPILWFSQVAALEAAACAIFKAMPDWQQIPVLAAGRGMCDSQFCAVGLMLLGYSLEVCLKAVTIVKKDVVAYTDEEKRFKHHQLDRLAQDVISLTDRDKAILRNLSHFTMWAGRYPDPGSGNEAKFEEIFRLAETNQLTLKDVLALTKKITDAARTIVFDKTA